MKRCISLFRLMMFLALLLLAACRRDDPVTVPVAETKDFKTDFNASADGWLCDFADYPQGGEYFYNLQYRMSYLPAPLNTGKRALMLSGNNHSDDLFMFIKKKLSGLEPNTRYQVKFDIEFASNAPLGSVGIGGSPGESVFIKAGACLIEPQKKLDSTGYYRMNIDKGNQSQDGRDMMSIGDFANETYKNEYALVRRNNTAYPFFITTDSSGEVWAVIGTDSGFEGITAIYYTSVGITFEMTRK